MLTARVLDIPARPMELARALRDRRGVSLLYGASRGAAVFLTCDPTECVRTFDPEPGLLLDPRAGDLARVPRWIGVLPYESRRALERPGFTRTPDDRPPAAIAEPIWWRYRAVAEIGDRVTVVGDDAASVDALSHLLERHAPPGEVSVSLERPLEPPLAHVQRIERALGLIGRGELYQVNLARRFSFRVHGHAVDLLAALNEPVAAPYAAALSSAEFDVISTSPELFLRLDATGCLETSPIKGTRPRGTDEASDRELAQALDSDPKERAELTMVLDVERNDLGRIALPGSVVLSDAPRVHTYKSLHHRVATLRAALRPDVTRTTLLCAMLPSGSVTGAPKVRAMEAIATLEPHRRGLYTGALGMLCHDGGLELAMAIRTLFVQGGRGEYFSGGGIVADSDPWREVEETEWKAVQLSALLSKG